MIKENPRTEVTITRQNDKCFRQTVIQRRWTQTAIECYERGCSCDDCILKDFLKAQSLNVK